MASGIRGRLSRSDLFALIFFELSEAYGDSQSSSQLLKASEELVRLIENDFGINEPEVFRAHPNYYTYDLVDAICSRCWQIACRETPAEFIEDRTFDPYVQKRNIARLGEA